MLKISIIMPVLNEAKHLDEILQHAQVFRDDGHEIIVIDGGSNDDTVDIAKRYSDQVIISERGRARQMNAGAEIAKGDVLMFLHADTLLPVESCELIDSASTEGYRWGHFNVRLSGENKLFRIIEFFINWRSRISSIATGDQAIFVNTGLFQKIGGFVDIPLMEDIALSKRLRRESKPMCLTNSVVTSSRRWEENGIVSTVLLMWRLRFLYFFGVSPERLIRLYR